jgi:hypothetical protein
MALTEAQLHQIGEYVKAHLREWVGDDVIRRFQAQRNRELIERCLEIESDLRVQRILME